MIAIKRVVMKTIPITRPTGEDKKGETNHLRETNLLTSNFLGLNYNTVKLRLQMLSHNRLNMLKLVLLTGGWDEMASGEWPAGVAGWQKIRLPRGPSPAEVDAVICRARPPSGQSNHFCLGSEPDTVTGEKTVIDVFVKAAQLGNQAIRQSGKISCLNWIVTTT